MATTIALFTRNLRVCDNPVLSAAARAGDTVVPLFVLDERILRSSFNRPNRAHFLAASLADLHDGLRARGGGLVCRRGDWADEVCRLAEQVDATEVHVCSDVTAHSGARLDRLADALSGSQLCVHDQVVTVVEPGEVTPSGGDHYAIFTPYLRQWQQRPIRPQPTPPERITLPRGLRSGPPRAADICSGRPCSKLLPGGETAGRRRFESWLESDVDDYAEAGDDLAADATSRLSPYLHFGCLSPVEVVARAARRDSAGARAFVLQVAWRDFHHQVLAARPAASVADYRPRGDRWRRDADAFAAWRDGRTGYPIVDAGMRQLATEGWMHNRARLIVGSFLTKTLYLDWRLGAQHFLDLLVDGDVANNQMNWQWVAGTGTDTRPHRVLNPLRQARRYDPQGRYVRRHVPELADLDVPEVHEPWRLPDAQRRKLGYPEPVIDLAEATERFRAARGR